MDVIAVAVGMLLLLLKTGSVGLLGGICRIGGLCRVSFEARGLSRSIVGGGKLS